MRAAGAAAQLFLTLACMAGCKTPSSSAQTSEWKYAPFFDQVKRAVGRTWDPNALLREHDPTGKIYGGRDRYTILEVTLGSDGLLKDIQVHRSSGVDFLDEAAIVSFRRAEPFPYPPSGLFGSNGTVTFPFGLDLEAGRAPVIRSSGTTSLPPPPVTPAGFAQA